MGRASEQWMEDNSRGYSSLDGDVCLDCIRNPDLSALHAEHSHSGSCAFCGQDDAIVAPAAVIQDRIMECLLMSYEQLDDAGVPYDGREGGYQISHESGFEIVSNELSGVVSDEFLEEVADKAMDSEWVEKDWALLHPYQRLTGGWEDFCRTIRHRLRYSFAFEPETDEGHPDSTSPVKTLIGISNLVDAYELIRTVKAGTEVIRLRVSTQEKYSSIGLVGSPPHQHAKANRMSAAGIPMFYGAFDLDTAIKETWDGINSAICSKGTFVTKHDIRVVDFTGLPPVPGYWSNPGRDQLATIRFMHDLARDISKPVQRNSSVDLLYAPTQVVAEYLLKARHLRSSSTSEGAVDEIHGVIFGSSHTGKPNFALNVYNSADSELASGNIQDDWLELVKVEHLPLMP